MIELSNVTKRYKDKIALNNIALDIHENGIYCLLGRNGAGKTTFMKLLAGHIRASEGHISVNGQKVSPENMSSNVSFIESRASQFNMSIADLIDAVKNLQDDFDNDFAQKMLTKFNLDKKKKYRQLSFGMQTMVTTIAGLASNSRVVMLDEPVLGFDALMRVQFNKLLYESYIRNPRIIIVSTHLIDEIARVAQNLIIIDNQNIQFRAPISEINEKFYAISGTTSEIDLTTKGINVIGKTTVHGVTTAFIFDRKINPSKNMDFQHASLNDFFVSLVGGYDNE